MSEHELSIGLSSEWFTPPEYFQALGLTFDLDPCSPGPGHWVPAKRIYTATDDNGIALVAARTSADWFHEVVVPARPLFCFPNGKTKFIRPDGSIGKEPGTGIVLLGMGDVACDALRRSDIGVCMVIVAPHRAAVSLAA
jgi:hypothetical protein